MIGDPAPIVGHDQRGSSRQVQQEESAVALGISAVGAAWSFAAVVGLQHSAVRAADAEVRVPHAGCTRRGTGEIPFHDDSAWGWAAGLEEHIGHLDRAFFAGSADAPGDLWVVNVAECVLFFCVHDHDDCPHFADDLDIDWTVDRVGDDVGAVVEVGDLVGSDGVEEVLHADGLIGEAIS